MLALLLLPLALGLARHGHEADGKHGLSHDSVRRAPQTQDLLLPRTHGDHEHATRSELVHERLGYVIGSRGDQDGVEGSGLGPTSVTVAGPQVKVLVLQLLQQRAGSLAAYGVAFHACGNTMKALQWTEKDLLPFAKVVAIGADDIMLLQEQGFAYISW